MSLNECGSAQISLNETRGALMSSSVSKLVQILINFLLAILRFLKQRKDSKIIRKKRCFRARPLIPFDLHSKFYTK